MSYRSISPQLKSSCYNCTHFSAFSDMLNGLCFQQSTEEGTPAIGVGTCGHFLMKADNGPARTGGLSRSPRDASRQKRAAR
ncbi:hypothetical protein ACFFNY_13445 [Paenibacillus hodogayensis]|uniref:Uncharacterized protein n=1 Tax=Paenibacillus hodogayensis TaxID=279208 RepID=A0ABV5VW71_9BACL